MTAKEAYEGIRKIEARYGTRFKPLDLHPVWNSLLQQPYAALVRAVGEMQMIWKRMPDGHQLLEAVRSWAQRLDLEAVEDHPESAAQFSLTIGFLEGRIDEAEYIRGLYAMSAKYGNPEYAEAAQQREAALKAKEAA